MWQTQGQTHSLFWSLSPLALLVPGQLAWLLWKQSRPWKAMAFAPSRSLSPFLAGPHPIALTCPPRVCAFSLSVTSCPLTV